MMLFIKTIAPDSESPARSTSPRGIMLDTGGADPARMKGSLFNMEPSN
jgi:hypothetical protein